MQWTPSCRHVHSDRKHSLVDAAEAEIQRTWRELQHKWPQATRQHLQLKVGNTFLEGDEGTLFVDGRRAEVCYVLHRAEPRNGLLLHAKADYPAGCFRLPTGGVKPGEDVVGSLEREVLEETSLDLSQGCRTQFLGQLDYAFQIPQVVHLLPFTTYIFTVEAPQSFLPVPLDETEEIEAWLWQLPSELHEIAHHLQHLQSTAPLWADWGRFRAPVHDFVSDCWVRLGCPTPP